MGMFDEVRCEARLPDGYDGGNVWFQTKSFPDPCLRRYTISRDGRLLDAVGHDCEPDGYITFYTRDPSADSSSADVGWRDYRACFSTGRLKSIVRVTADMRVQERHIHYGLASFRWFAPPSAGPDEADGKADMTPSPRQAKNNPIREK